MIYHTRYYVNEKNIGFNVRFFFVKNGRIIDKTTGKDCGELMRTK